MRLKLFSLLLITVFHLHIQAVEIQIYDRQEVLIKSVEIALTHSLVKEKKNTVHELSIMAFNKAKIYFDINDDFFQYIYNQNTPWCYQIFSPIMRSIFLPQYKFLRTEGISAPKKTFVNNDDQIQWVHCDNLRYEY